MLENLARAASPLAVDLLLDQPRRWAGRRADDPLADATVLGRLVEPARVVAVGAANIGKSSLINAVAQNSVALAFDRPGTTRDPVGVLVDLGGLVVRWIDTPGMTPGDREAAATVGREIAGADLVLRCADAGSDGPVAAEKPDARSLVVALRADRARPRFAADVVTSASDGVGLDALADAVRRSLVSDEAMSDPRPWKFWEDIPATAGA
jgi:tRNA modification GTPase